MPLGQADFMHLFFPYSWFRLEKKNMYNHSNILYQLLFMIASAFYIIIVSSQLKFIIIFSKKDKKDMCSWEMSQQKFHCA